MAACDGRSTSSTSYSSVKKILISAWGRRVPYRSFSKYTGRFSWSPGRQRKAEPGIAKRPATGKRCVIAWLNTWLIPNNPGTIFIILLFTSS